MIKLINSGYFYQCLIFFFCLTCHPGHYCLGLLSWRSTVSFGGGDARSERGFGVGLSVFMQIQLLSMALGCEGHTV